MKRLITLTLTLHFSLFILHSATAESYTLIGQRHLRLYTAPEPTQAYNASVDAQRIADNLCNVPWTPARALDATTTSHVNDQLDENVRNRDLFDAALFCAEHTNGQHRAYANAAVYRYRLPDGALPNLVSLTAKISSDPYNALGARVVLYSNATGEIPTDCATCRGETSGGVKLAGIAQRITKNVVESGNTNSYWYPATTNATFNLSTLQSFNLQRYIFVFVLMENYASSRGNWLEGCSYMENRISITTDGPVPGWIDGDTIDLSKTGSYSAAPDEWMPYFETTNTIVTATKNGETADFAAPQFAFRLVHFGSTNLMHVTHRVSKFDEETWTRGAAVSNLTGWTVAKVRSSRRVAVSGHDVYLERGFEVDPPSRGSVRSDTDGDGIADGWEVYVGSDPLDPSDATSDWDDDGLTLSEEYDHGHFPTDPRKWDTNGDLIPDRDEFRFHLKCGDSALDSDGDGLSNYSEYLANMVFAFAPVDPDNPYSVSTNRLTDYSIKVGREPFYLGEILTDHDMMPDEWEDKTIGGDSRYRFNAHEDADGDGWSNYEEFRAGSNPLEYMSVPRPKIVMDVVNAADIYLGGTNGTRLVIRAWNEIDDPDMTSRDYAEWKVDVADHRNTTVFTLDAADLGDGHRLKSGPNCFMCFVDENGRGAYVPGAPFGVVRGVDVGWQGAKFTVELSETSPITDRIRLTDNADDRDATVQGKLRAFLNDRTLWAIPAVREATNETQKAELMAIYAAAISNRVRTVSVGAGMKTNVRVVRYGIDAMFCYNAGIGQNGFDERVVMEKKFDMNGRDFLNEADFLTNGVYDIDWATMTGTDYRAGAIVSADGTPLGTSTTGPKGAGCSVTNMTYLVVVGDGAKDFRGSDDTNHVVQVAGVISRRFEKTRSLPVAEDLGIVRGARPTFVWSMPNEDKWASEFGSTYTAFRIQVMNDKGKTIYDSDIQRAPAQVKKNGKLYFTWTADLYAGDFTKQKWDFLATGDFTWRVSMYNAKFRSDDWSNEAKFSTAVNAQHDVNDNGYSSVNVAVKYAGSASVLEECMNLATPKGKIHIQAFATADFSGEPVAQVYTTAKASIVDTSKLEPNAKLIGLPAGGTYSIRAYIDMNGNRVKDDWEPWGCAKESVVLKDCVTAPSVGLYIEDADTDNDLVPDAYEYAAAGWTGDFEDIKHAIASAVDGEGKILFTAEGYMNLTNGLASLSTAASGASLTLMMNTNYWNAVSGPGSVTITADAARVAYTNALHNASN